MEVPVTITFMTYQADIKELFWKSESDRSAYGLCGDAGKQPQHSYTRAHVLVDDEPLLTTMTED